MKPKKFGIIILLSFIFILIACERNQTNSSELNNLEVIEMIVEYQQADFNDWADWFNGFDPDHIYNFHYVILTDHHNRFPGPTDDRIEGFFNITMNEWDNYVNDDTFRQREWEAWESELDKINASSNVSGIELSELNWEGNLNWMITHRGRGVGGSMLINRENRIVWFTLSR